MLLQQLREWEPFRLDALSLITLLGAEQVDRIVGQLVWNRFAEWLPLLASNTIASDQITQPIPGFVLYNITDGIMATDLAGWFARWLLCEDLTPCSTTITITSDYSPQSLGIYLLPSIVGLLAAIPPIVIASLIRDAWSLVATISMALSVITRQLSLYQNRRGLDRSMQSSFKSSDQPVKVFLTIPGGIVVTIRTTRGIVVNSLLTKPCPPHRRFYTATKLIGWLVFGTFVVSLGMASLLCQVMIVCLLLISTTVAGYQIGAQRYRIGRFIGLARNDSAEQFRAATYARLKLTPVEEQCMVDWHLFPQRSNVSWWQKYRQQCAVDNGFSRWNEILGTT
ncbi:hypothetical protein BJX61DRAFT_541452 [Aspergillus egyptiacus]|nr:hypothetical protein BJX61DRAFT_541452 [Aspergillus egyptiacus]